jgi:hypothetical protein
MQVPEHQIRIALEVFRFMHEMPPRMEGRVPTMTEDDGISRRSYWVKESRT